MITARALLVLSGGALLVGLTAACGIYRSRLRRIASACAAEHAFSANVAHELRASLTHLLLNAEITLARPRRTSELQAALRSNLHELQGLHRVIEDMLFLARQGKDAGRLLVEASAAQEVQGSLDALADAIQEKGIAARMEGDLQARAFVDPALFRRALSNLVLNAVAHSCAGDWVTVHIASEGAFVWIRVSNAGETIPGEHLSRLFDAFYQVRPVHTPGPRHGYGLGLSIVKAIAGVHGGSVSASSRDGVTSIAFSVPAAAR
jgi:two-component system heavy metal sensor histidine kinase CusS